MGGGVQPIRSLTSCSTATPIRLAINRHDAPFSSRAQQMRHHAHPGRCPDLGCQDIGIGSISRLMRPRKPGQQASQFLNTGITQLLNRIPNVTHREHAGQPHGWQSDAADGDDRAALTATHAVDSTGGASGSSSMRLRIPCFLLQQGRRPSHLISALLAGTGTAFAVLAGFATSPSPDQIALMTVAALSASRRPRGGAADGPGVRAFGADDRQAPVIGVRLICVPGRPW